MADLVNVEGGAILYVVKGVYNVLVSVEYLLKCVDTQVVLAH